MHAQQGGVISITRTVACLSDESTLGDAFRVGPIHRNALTTHEQKATQPE